MDSILLVAAGLGAISIYFFVRRAPPKKAPKSKPKPPRPYFAPVADLRTRAVPLDTKMHMKPSLKLTPAKRQTDEGEAGSRERFYGGY